MWLVSVQWYSTWCSFSRSDHGDLELLEVSDDTNWRVKGLLQPENSPQCSAPPHYGAVESGPWSWLYWPQSNWLWTNYLIIPCLSPLICKIRMLYSDFPMFFSRRTLYLSAVSTYKMTWNCSSWRAWRGPAVPLASPKPPVLPSDPPCSPGALSDTEWKVLSWKIFLFYW